MGRQRELGAGLGEPLREPQVGNVGGLTVGQRAVGWFQVGGHAANLANTPGRPPARRGSRGSGKS